MWTSQCFVECCREAEKAMDACCGQSAHQQWDSCFEVETLWNIRNVPQITPA